MGEPRAAQTLSRPGADDDRDGAGSWASAVGRSTAGSRSGELDRDVEDVRYGPRPPVPTKLDPYKAIIRDRLEAYPELSSVRLLEEIRAAGYDGGYTQLKEYVRNGAAPAARGAGDPVRDGARACRPRSTSPTSASRGASRYALMVVLGYSPAALAALLPAPGHASPAAGARGGVRLLRRRARGAAVRPDEERDHPGPAA